MKIAIVESDGLLAELISFRLELIGYQVSRYLDADDLLSALETDPPSLLIANIIDSGQGGCEIVRRVRKVLAADELPILATAADTDLSLVETAYRAGANDYLILPFEPTVLQSKASALLEQLS